MYLVYREIPEEEIKKANFFLSQATQKREHREIKTFKSF